MYYSVLEKRQRFPEIEPVSIYDLWCAALELSWHWWLCHLANVLQWPYNEAQGLLEVQSSTILDLVSSTSLCCVLWICHSFKGCPLPPSLLFHYHEITVYHVYSFLYCFYIQMYLHPEYCIKFNVVLNFTQITYHASSIL